MKIGLFDDHPVMLEGLRHYFLRKEGVEVVGAVHTKSEVLELLTSQPVDILVSDVLTDEELGLELFEEIQANNFDTKVVVYSSLKSDLVYNFLYNYGVVAIVHKTKGLDELWKMVELAYFASQYKKESDNAPPPSLTPKEKEIVKYLARGLTAKDIGILTQTSVHTINNQKNHLLAKFGCVNAAELVSKLMQMGYLKL
jgi:two-component system, NarL family, captular synthesis response regulator RcsB